MLLAFLSSFDRLLPICFRIVAFVRSMLRHAVGMLVLPVPVLAQFSRVPCGAPVRVLLALHSHGRRNSSLEWK